MIATGFPVFGGQALDDLRAEAAEWLKRRPPALTSDEDTWARYSAATLFEDGEDVAERDPALASALLGEAVLEMLRYYSALGTARFPGARACCSTSSAPIEKPPSWRVASTRRPASRSARLAARELADRTIRARGFFEWDSSRASCRMT